MRRTLPALPRFPTSCCSQSSSSRPRPRPGRALWKAPRRVVFHGSCVIAAARKGGSGIAGAFTVRKISFGEGVERVFPLYSTNIDSIEVVRRGRVRRAKLYYLRSRRGKSARIAEVTNYKALDA